MNRALFAALQFRYDDNRSVDVNLTLIALMSHPAKCILFVLIIAFKRIKGFSTLNHTMKKLPKSVS